jgi:hypothetical protein
MATSHSRFVEPGGRIMAMSLTQDEQLVLRHLVSGETSEEIAAALNWPIHVVRNCTHTLIIWVLDELETSGRTPSKYLPAPPPDRRSWRVWDVVRGALILAAWVLGIGLVVAAAVSVIWLLMQDNRNPF